MRRVIEERLIEWKDKSNRKPILIYGARQVGKTWLMKTIAKNHFTDYVYINFEKEIEYKTIFESSLVPDKIIKSIEILSGKKITIGKTVLLFDEIQEAENGLTSLKYFNEDLSKLHIVAAGSLLGIALKQESFPVGQVEFLNLRPLSFTEFLLATQNEDMVELLIKNDWETMKMVKQKYLQLLRHYYFVGGMPEVVQVYLDSNQDFEAIRSVHNNILQAYEQDFAKHAPAQVIPKIRMVWDTLVSQLAKENKKFIYGVVKQGGRAKEFEQALNWLEDYGLIHKIYSINKASFPLSSYMDLKSFKVYLLDVGLLGAKANLSSKSIIEKEVLFKEFKGALTEQFVLQELTSILDQKVYYWINNTGNAELDFIFENNQKIIPLEVKAAENLKAKSLKTFHEKHPAIWCYRTSTSDYRAESWMTNIPLYGVVGVFGSHEV